MPVDFQEETGLDFQPVDEGPTLEDKGFLGSSPSQRIARLESIPVIGGAIEKLIGPPVQDPTRPPQGVLPAAAMALEGTADKPGVLRASPAMLIGEPKSYGEALTKHIIEQINPENIFLGGILGKLHAAKEATTALNLAKAGIATYFGKQGAEAVGSSLGERTSGAPLTPERKAELDVQTGMGTLMAAAPFAAREAPVKPSGLGPQDVGEANLTMSDQDYIAGRLPPERQLAGPRGNFSVSPTGQVIDLDQLTPKEKTELFRGPKEFIPRGDYVKPTGNIDADRINAALAEARGAITLPRTGPTPIPRPFAPPEIEPAFQAAGEPKQGGQISFGAEASGTVIPSARQTGISQTGFKAGFGAEQPPGLIEDVSTVVMSKDRTALQEMRDKISGKEQQAPGVGTVSQANDVLRVIDQRLKELKSDRIDPELEQIRRTILGRKPIDIPAEVTVLPQERTQLSEPKTKQLGEGQKLLPAPPAEPTTERTPDATETRQEQTGSEPEHTQADKGGAPAEASGGDRPVEPAEGQAVREVSLKPGEQAEAPKTEVAKTEAQKVHRGIGKDVRARLEKEGPPPGGEAGFINLGILEDIVDFGKTIFQKGMDFARWSGEMLKELGENAKAYLQHAWNSITGQAPKVVSDFEKALNSPDFGKPEFRANEKLSSPTGLAMRSIADLDAMADLREKLVQQMREVQQKVREEPDKAKAMQMMQEGMNLSIKAQLAREAIEVATDSGSWVEADKPSGRKLGERPLDWKGNRQVSNWLESNSERTGIKFERPPDRGIASAVRSGKVAPQGEAGFINVGQAIADARRKLRTTREAFKTLFKSTPTRHQMDQSLDAADSMAKIEGQKMGNSVRKSVPNIKPEEDIAASAIVAANFDRARLPNLLAKAIAGGNREAEAGIRLAMANWGRIEPIARRGHEIMNDQLVQENASGINTEYREGYLPGIYDMDLWMGSSCPYMIAGSRGGGIASGFKKGKTYASPFDAIEQGYVPRSLKLSELVEHRVNAGGRLINRVEWGNALRSVTDPTDGNSIVTSLLRRQRRPGLPAYETAPQGYVPREIIPGVRVAVHEGYARLFDTLLGRSHIEDFEVKGLPVGNIALQAHGGIKHGLLLFDSFHASRIMQKQLFLSKKISYNRGRTLLEYQDRDLNQAVADGEITQEMADYARTNRPKAELLVKSGLNVGRIQEALYTQAIRNIPVIGRANKWIFEKLTRGAMLESGIIEFDRMKDNNPTWSDEQVARTVSRDLNKYFGNLGRQGVFKSKTMMDLTRLAFLAPQWVESVVRSEIGGAKQLALDPLLKRKLQVGSLGVGMGRGLAMYLLATQVGNLITTGLFKGKAQPTWENEDKGHKLDMWVPDLTGKTRGFYMSPMGVVAETTHDLMRAMKSEPDILSAAGHVLANKASPEWRAGKVLLEGKDWSQNEVAGVWNKAKAAGLDLLPVPIPASSIIKGGQPGSTQRLIMQSLGGKTEPAGSAKSNVMERARDWGLHSSSPKIVQHFTAKFPPSQYAPLKKALVVNKPDKIVDEIKTLLTDAPNKETRMKQILKEFEPFNERDIKPFATRAKETEIPFVQSLDAAGKRQYVEAVREQIRDYQRLTQALYGRASNPPIPERYRSTFTQ